MPAEPFIGEIAVYGFNFSPRGWAFCDGSILAIASNTALFSLLGTTYGGNGQTTFALPDFRGRIPINYGQGPGLPLYQQGQTGGSTTQTLTPAQLPPHTHGVAASVALPAAAGAGTVDNPVGAVPAGSAVSENYTAPASANGSFAPGSASLTAAPAGGAAQPFSTQAPYLTLNFCIATQGIYPSRN